MAVSILYIRKIIGCDENARKYTKTLAPVVILDSEAYINAEAGGDGSIDNPWVLAK